MKAAEHTKNLYQVFNESETVNAKEQQICILFKWCVIVTRAGASASNVFHKRKFQIGTCYFSIPVCGGV
jgi:hypothetical protein